jgi:hypothetical protein
MAPSGRSTVIGPAKIIDFPGADVWKKLAKLGHRSDQCADRGNRRARRTKMKTFTIETETNNITLHATIQEAEAVANAQRFRNEACSLAGGNLEQPVGGAAGKEIQRTARSPYRESGRRLKTLEA